MTRSSYSNQISKEQVPQQDVRDPLETATQCTVTKGGKASQTKGPRGGWGAESASLRRPGRRRGHYRGTVVGGPRREEATARHALAARPAAGAVTPLPRPGPRPPAEPSRVLRCCARAGGAHFPKFGELTQVAAASSTLQHFLPEILPGLRPPGSSQSLRPQGRGGGGSGPDSEGRKCRRGASRDL